MRQKAPSVMMGLFFHPKLSAKIIAASFPIITFISNHIDPLKTLIIHRHAKSSWDDFSLSDFERPLNNRGEADAPDMGRRLKLQGIHIDHIISSPARRAIDTAHLVAAELHYPLSKIEQDQRIYHASVRTLLNVINQIDDKRRTAMIFGHNPGLTELIDYLTGSDIGNLPTSGQGIIDFDLDSWSEVSRSTGTLVHLDFPKNG